MDDCPFQLRVKRASPPGVEEIACLALLRVVPGTRYVYDAMWKNQRVVVKVFTKWGKARWHVMREWRGLKQLETRQVKAPCPLFCGRTSGGWAVATGWLDGAVTAGDMWNAADTIERKSQVMSLIARQLGYQHDRGVIQADMHLGNFMIRGQEVFVLDPAMMRFARRPVGRRQSMQQVARLAAILSEEDIGTIESVFGEYAQTRSWTVGPQDLEQLRKEHRRQRSKAIEQGLRKFLRTNRRHQAIRAGSWRGLADRKLSEAATLAEISTALNDAMARGEILKNGKTSFVSRVTLGGIDVVVKRYNHKGLLHSLRHTFKGSRAERCWLNANRLLLLGIDTPKPVAYLDRYCGPFLQCSYLITEFVDGQGLHGILRDRNVSDDRKQRLIDAVVRTLDRMATYGISHGDLKHTNILCRDDAVELIDLDDMQIHKIVLWQQYRHNRDVARFLRDVRGLEGTSTSA